MLFFLLFSSPSPQTPKGKKKKITKKNSPTKKSPTKAELKAKLEKSTLTKDRLQVIVNKYPRNGKAKTRWGPTVAYVVNKWKADHDTTLKKHTYKKHLIDSDNFVSDGFGSAMRFAVAA